MSSEERTLKIKVAVVLRLEKELLRYGEEASAQAAKVSAMRAREADEHDVRKQVEVLAEAEMMIPDTARRLQAATADLAACLVTARASSSSLASSPHVSAAEAALARNAATLNAGAPAGASAADDDGPI